MGQFLAASVVAATLSLGVALPASASTISFPVSGVTHYPQGTFDYKFVFTLDTESSIDGITGSASSVYGGTSNVSFSSVSVLDALNDAIYSSPASGPSFQLFPHDLTASSGNYTLEVTGSVSGGTGSFNGNLSISAVPLPNSVALLGTALLGLGVYGAVRRGKGSATAA